MGESASMSVKIDKEASEVVDGDQVDVYELPVDGGTALDLNLRGGGYTAEWETSLDLPGFDRLVRASVLDYESAPTEGTFEGRDSVVESEFSSIRDCKGYFEDGTYLVVHSENYDIAWEKWDDENRIILNVPSGDSRILERYFPETASEFIERESKDRGLEQANRLLQN